MTTEALTPTSHLESTPGVAGGKPRIRGRRITVHNIAIWHERLGWSVDEICAEFDLSMAEVYAALTYYFDHRAEIDREIERSEAFVEELRATRASPLHRKIQTQLAHG